MGLYMAKSPVTNTPQVDAADSDRLALLKTRLSIAKAWAKKPQKAWKEYISEYNVDDFGATDEIRDKVRIGYIFRKVESDLPAIFDDQLDLFIKGRKARTKDIEPLIEGLYDYLWDSQHLDEKLWQGFGGVPECPPNSCRVGGPPTNLTKS